MQSAFSRAMSRWFAMPPVQPIRVGMSRRDKVARRVQKHSAAREKVDAIYRAALIVGNPHARHAEYDQAHYIERAYFWLLGGDAETAWEYRRAAAELRRRMKA